MQIERLVQMVFYILSHGHVTAKELADLFQVSTRTVYRDINTLTVAGIPIFSTKGVGGGIFLMEGFAIDKSLLSEEERQSIYQGLQILRAARYPNAEMALSKIGAIFRNAMEAKWLDVDFSHWGSEEKEKIQFSDLQYAILNRHVITFRYFNSDLKQSERAIEPLRLVFKSHAWYLIGYCRSRQEMRCFRLSRMKRLKVMPEMFERDGPSCDALTSEWKELREMPVLQLKFSPEIAYRLYDEFQEDQIRLSEDGNYYVAASFELNHWTVHYLLSFGKYVEVIEPESARAMLKELASDIVKLYSL